MKITGLQQQKRRRDRVSVFLDEEFWIGITERLCNELGLWAGMEVSAEKKEEIEKAALSDGVLQYAYDRLGQKLLPEAELRTKMQERGYSPATIDSAIGRCHELQLLDDELWAETVAEERRARGQGPGRVREILRRGGIDSDTSEEVLERVFPGEDDELAREALQRKYQGPLDPREQRQAWAMLLRRGFSSESASRVVEEMAMSAEEEEEQYGWEEALLLLERRFPEEVTESRARSFLQRRAFSPGAISEALRSFDRLRS